MTQVNIRKLIHIKSRFLDSIIYKYSIDENDGGRNGDPLETGPELGDMVDEYPNHTILEFVGGTKILSQNFIFYII